MKVQVEEIVKGVFALILVGILLYLGFMSLGIADIIFPNNKIISACERGFSFAKTATRTSSVKSTEYNGRYTVHIDVTGPSGEKGIIECDVVNKNGFAYADHTRRSTVNTELLWDEN